MIHAKYNTESELMNEILVMNTNQEIIMQKSKLQE